MSDMKKWLQLMESANVCPQCGSPDCTCEPGECDCEPAEATELEQGNNFDINETVVPSRLQQWLDKKDWTIMATKPYKLDKSSMHFLASDTLGDDREGILMKYPNEKGQYVVVFNTVPNRKDWVNAMIESDELDETRNPIKKFRRRGHEAAQQIFYGDGVFEIWYDEKGSEFPSIDKDPDGNTFADKTNDPRKLVRYAKAAFKPGQKIDVYNYGRKYDAAYKAGVEALKKAGFDVYAPMPKNDSVQEGSLSDYDKHNGIPSLAKAMSYDGKTLDDTDYMVAHLAKLGGDAEYAHSKLDNPEFMRALAAELGVADTGFNDLGSAVDDFKSGKSDFDEGEQHCQNCDGSGEIYDSTTGETHDCPECSGYGMAEAHGNSKIYDKCWDGYKKVPGKRRGEKGSCVKEDETMNDFNSMPQELQQVFRGMMSINWNKPEHAQYDAGPYRNVYTIKGSGGIKNAMLNLQDMDGVEVTGNDSFRVGNIDVSVREAGQWGTEFVWENPSEENDMNEMARLRKLAGLPESDSNKPYEKQVGMGDSRSEKEIRDQISGLSDATLKKWSSKPAGRLGSKVAKLQDKLVAAEMKKRGLDESISSDGTCSAYTSEGYDDDEFENGDRIRFKDGYDEGKGEVFTLQNWDGRRGWAADEDGRGWSVTASQIEKVDDDEESGGSIWDDPDWRDDELDEAKMRLSRDHVAKATKVWARAKKNDFLNSEASDAVIKFAMDKLKYPKERAEMLAIAAETAHDDPLDALADLEEGRAVTWTSGEKPDKEHLWAVHIDGEEEGTYHSLEQAKKVVTNRKKSSPHRKYSIKRIKRTGAYTHESADTETCKACSGKGHKPGAGGMDRDCEKCDGTGKVVKDKVDESYPMAPYVEQDDETNVSFTQTKHMGDATVTVSANAKSMEELHSVLKLAGIDPGVADKYAEPETPNLPVAVDEPEMGGCGSEEPMGMSYSTDKQALIDMIRQKMQKKLG